jgi:signal transduction histidine kinase
MSPEGLAEIQSHGTGVRIRGMHERARHFRGDLLIESNGSSTKAYATFPLTTLSTHKSNKPQNVRSCQLDESDPA